MWMRSPTRAPPVLRGAVDLLMAPVFDRSARALMSSDATTEDRCAPPECRQRQWGLAAQPQPLDERAVALHVFVLQVAQQPTAATDELQQPTLGVEVVLVGLHVLGEIADPTAQQRDL